MHDQNRKNFVSYDFKLLRNFFRNLIFDYKKIFIIINALNECIKNVINVMKLLTNLNDNTNNVNVNFLFLNKNEFEIRNFFDAKFRIFIVAENNDFKFYVCVEIEEKIIKKKLKIKNSSFKKHIIKRLIDDANEMYVFVF